MRELLMKTNQNALQPLYYSTHHKHCYPVFFHRGEPFDRGLIHAIESVIIDWTHQIKSVLKRDSAQPLLEGHNPGPNVELDFWKSRAMNLECIFEQVSA